MCLCALVVAYFLTRICPRLLISPCWELGQVAGLPELLHPSVPWAGIGPGHRWDEDGSTPAPKWIKNRSTDVYRDEGVKTLVIFCWRDLGDHKLKAKLEVMIPTNSRGWRQHVWRMAESASHQDSIAALEACQGKPATSSARPWHEMSFRKAPGQKVM